MPAYLLDTDVGTDVDDALAIAYLASRPDAELIGVTTVHGNAPLRAEIARRLLQTTGRDVPVVAGRSAPLRRSAVENFHWGELWGHEGVGLVPEARRFPADPAPERDDGAQFIIDMSRQHPGLTLLTIGPVTNLARALEMYPALPSQIGRVVMMGGLIDRSKVTWGAHFETNFNADPLAAEIVLGSELAMELVPLDVTLQVHLGGEELERMRGSEKPLVAAVLRLIQEMRDPFKRFGERYGLEGSNFEDRVYLHDPLAVAVGLGAPYAAMRRTRLAVGWEGKALRTLDVGEGGRPCLVCEAVDAARAVDDWMKVVVG